MTDPHLSDPNIQGRPKSWKIKEIKLEEDESRRSGDDRDEDKPLPTLKAMMGMNKNRTSRLQPAVGFQKKHRKIKVVSPANTPVPITRRTRLHSNLQVEISPNVKKKGLRLFKKHTEKESKTTFSQAELDSFILEDDKNENLPEDFEYDLRLYNSPQSKGKRASDGKVRLVPHPCTSSNPQRELMYREGNKVEREVPEEMNLDLDRTLSDDFARFLSLEVENSAPPVPPLRSDMAASLRRAESRKLPAIPTGKKPKKPPPGLEPPLPSRNDA